MCSFLAFFFREFLPIISLIANINIIILHYLIKKENGILHLITYKNIENKNLKIIFSNITYNHKHNHKIIDLTEKKYNWDWNWNNEGKKDCLIAVEWLKIEQLNGLIK